MSRSVQRPLPPMPLNKVEDGVVDRKKVENGEDSARTEALRVSGRLIELARERAGLTRKEACALMGIGEAQYSRWISGAANDTPSFARLLLLPPDFWIEMNALISDRYQLRQRVLARLLAAAADVVALAPTTERA